MAVYSMLCTDGLLLHLVGKRQLLVYSGASYGNGKLGDSIWESHHKSSAQGACRVGKHFPMKVFHGAGFGVSWQKSL